VVRADASKRSRLVASIGPNSRVQLGESRGDWRRIRAKGLAGWVEQRAEFRVATR
jgi:SH3-like domain-containing protein